MAFVRKEHVAESHDGIRRTHGSLAVGVADHEGTCQAHAALVAVVEGPFHEASVVAAVGNGLAQHSEKLNCWLQHTTDKLDPVHELREVDGEARRRVQQVDLVDRRMIRSIRRRRETCAPGVRRPSLYRLETWQLSHQWLDLREA